MDQSNNRLTGKTTELPRPVPAGSVAETRRTVQQENTALERRVLAHERILQALIGNLAETDPKLLERLTDRFCAPAEMARCEHDYTDTDAYAEEFVRSLIGRT